jgi:hypothetical protein
VRVAIDDSNWAEIKPVEELTRAHRKAVNEFLVSEYDPASGRLVIRASADDAMSAALLHLICTDWSLPIHNPSMDKDSLDRLSLEQDEKLRAAIQPHINAIKGLNAPVPANEVPTKGSAS